MTEVQTLTQEASLGFKIRRLRVAQLLTQLELAGMAGISQEDVDLLERNLPVPLDTKRKLLKMLWARKAHNW